MSRFGLPPRARLLKPADFAALRRASRRIGGRHFLAEVALTPRDTARLGQAVSRRVSKRAVDRNRIKRVVRDSYRHVRADLPACDLLLIARPSAVAAPNAELRADLERLWQRIAALKVEAAAGTMRD